MKRKGARGLQKDLNAVYESMQGSEASERYSERHGIKSQAILTITDDEAAFRVAEHLAPRIEGKTVVEIGGGIGLLALHLGQFAKRVYCIEANPMWSWIFAGTLLHNKPKNVSFLFGSADEFVGTIKGDVAIYLTHSGVTPMRVTAMHFAPVVIDVYGELVAEHPERFDELARTLRAIA